MNLDTNNNLLTPQTSSADKVVIKEEHDSSKSNLELKSSSPSQSESKANPKIANSGNGNVSDVNNNESDKASLSIEERVAQLEEENREITKNLKLAKNNMECIFRTLNRHRNTFDVLFAEPEASQAVHQQSGKRSADQQDQVKKKFKAEVKTPQQRIAELEQANSQLIKYRQNENQTHNKTKAKVLLLETDNAALKQENAVLIEKNVKLEKELLAAQSLYLGSTMNLKDLEDI